jgi:hypothetical protein
VPVTAALILAAALALQAALPTPGDPIAWESVIRAPEGELLIAPSSIRRDGTVARINVRINIAETPNTSLATGITEFRFDCAARAMGYGASRLFDRNGRDIGSSPAMLTGSEMEPLSDDVIEQALFRRVCG